jgi:hypothetical protein
LVEKELMKRKFFNRQRPRREATLMAMWSQISDIVRLSSSEGSGQASSMEGEGSNERRRQHRDNQLRGGG